MEFMNQLKSHPKEKQLFKLNLYLNQLLSQHDIVTQKVMDSWATPKEFLINGYGDCEDYAIIKYFSLIKLGFSRDKLFLTIVRDTYSNRGHMVLSYFQSNEDSPLILDNLSFKILNLDQRKDLKADLFFNESGIYTLEKKQLEKIDVCLMEYKELLKKIKQEN